MPELETLNRQECLALLRRVPIGRIAFTEQALPAIELVNFTVHDGAIIIPTGAGSRLARAVPGQVVAFAIDEMDAATRTGWDVTVVGLAEEITDPVDCAALSVRPLPPRMLDQPVSYLRIRLQVLNGRRLGPVNAA